MKYLPPLTLKQKYYRGIEDAINAALRAVIYGPLLKSFKDDESELFNSDNALLDAIRSGSIWWDDGKFSGQFNAQTTKALRALGATYNAASKTWALPRDRLTGDLLMAQAHADMRYDAIRRSFLTTLDDMRIDSLDNYLHFAPKYEEAIAWMDEDFQKTVRAITIEPKLTPKSQQIIARDWAQNLDLYVKDWAAENILKLRQQVQANTFDGRRPEQLFDMLRANYGVSQRKAEFLARQETSLLLSKFRENRYAEIGITSYRWSTSHDERVRHDHRELNNKVFNFSQPPVTDHRTGARNNPGEDFNCRCAAIPIVD